MKKMFIVALLVASTLVACGGKKKSEPVNPTPPAADGSAAGSAEGSADGSAAPAGEGGGSGM
jgi:hypothetical protein